MLSEQWLIRKGLVQTRGIIGKRIFLLAEEGEAGITK